MVDFEPFKPKSFATLFATIVLACGSRALPLSLSSFLEEQLLAICAGLLLGLLEPVLPLADGDLFSCLPLSAGRG